MTPCDSELLPLLQSIAQSLEGVEQQQRESLSRLDELQNFPQREVTILPLKEAWKVLGYTSYMSCYRQIETLYRVGIEAIDRRKGSSSEANWFLDIEKCLERDRSIPTKRSPSKRGRGKNA